MSVHKFRLEDEDSLIIIKATIGNDRLSLALDTGATHTVIDLTTLLLEGYEITDALSIIPLETAKGVIDAYIFKIKSLTALGITYQNMEICSYDFFDNNVLSDIHGVLGLNFFKNKDLLISFKRFEITIT
jgi:predicted aspartyl protease